MKKLLFILLLVVGGIVAVDLYLVKPPFSLPGLKGDENIVPKLVGFPLEEAKKRIAEIDGLSPNGKASNRTEGIVIGQKPAPGDRFKPGDEVTLYVASKPSLPVIPNLIGLSEKGAEIRVQSIEGLSIEEQIRKESDETPGTVIGQIPDPDTPFRAGDRMILHIAIPRALPALTEKVRGILEEMHVPVERLDFVLRGRLDYRETSNEEDIWTVYTCQPTYEIYVFTVQHEKIMGPMVGSFEKWSPDQDRARDVAFNDLAKKTAKRLAAAFYPPEREGRNFLSSVNEESAQWWNDVDRISREIQELERRLP